MVMMIENSFWVDWKRLRSSWELMSTSMSLAPARSCMIMEEVMIGEIPSSIKVPLLEARMTRSQ
jgi:hypothetical protein